MLLVPLTMLLLRAAVNEVRLTMPGTVAALDAIEALLLAKPLELVEIA